MVTGLYVIYDHKMGCSSPVNQFVNDDVALRAIDSNLTKMVPYPQDCELRLVGYYDDVNCFVSHLANSEHYAVLCDDLSMIKEVIKARGGDEDGPEIQDGV